MRPRRPEGETVEDDDHADLRVRARRHERVHPTATEAEDGQSLDNVVVMPEASNSRNQIQSK